MTADLTAKTLQLSKCAFVESGSWRTRHLRLRAAVVRQDLESYSWKLSHPDVFMPADSGTKAVGPARLEDLIKVFDFWAPHSQTSLDPPRTVSSLDLERKSPNFKPRTGLRGCPMGSPLASGPSRPKPTRLDPSDSASPETFSPKPLAPLDPATNLPLNTTSV